MISSSFIDVKIKSMKQGEIVIYRTIEKADFQIEVRVEDESVLVLLSKRKSKVTATIYTAHISKQLELDIKRFHVQYPKIDIKIFNKSHDRFLIIDHHIIYHIGASLKDLGKKWFAFSKIGLDVDEMIEKL